MSETCPDHGWHSPRGSALSCPECLLLHNPVYGENVDGAPLRLALEYIQATRWQTITLRSVAEVFSMKYALDMAKGWQR